MFSYVVRYDFGFAPNPFHGVCTLATCKPQIRRAAAVGDWVVGTGSAPNRLTGRLVYSMRVSEAMSYDDYWNDPRFLVKRPNLRGSLIQAFGDNIYHNGPKGWMQANSRHSLDDGTPNRDHIKKDTSSPRLLIGSEFYYWGGLAPKIPQEFRDWSGHDICQKRTVKYKFPIAMAEAFIIWIKSHGEHGILGEPAAFRNLGG